MPAEVLDISSAEYHKDTKRVSASMLKALLASPQDYYQRWVQDPPRIVEPTPGMILGLATDCRVFEPEKFDTLFACRPDGIDARTKEGKAKLAEYRESLGGKTELTPEQLAKSQAMSFAVLANEMFGELLADPDAKRQYTIVWQDDAFDVPCKARLDLYIPRQDQETDLILDLKTSSDPSPEDWGRDSQWCPMRKFFYALQLAHYEEAVYRATGRHSSIGLVVVGSAVPHDVYCYDCADWLATGRLDREAAMEMLLQCQESNVWLREEQKSITRISPFTIRRT